MSGPLSRADRLAAAGSIERAHELYAEAAANRVTGAHERLCHAKTLLGHDDVLHCTEEALQLLPSSSFLHALDGQVALMRGLVQCAATSYARAAELAPADPDMLINLGISLNAAGQPQQSAKRLRSAISLTPRSAAAYHELARALESAAHPGAEAVCRARERAAHLSPTSAERHLDLGESLLAAQRPSEAFDVLQKALQLATGSPTLSSLALFGIGRSALARGEPCDARDALARATKLIPNDADHWHQQGIASQRCSWYQRSAALMGRTPNDEAGSDAGMANARLAWRRALELEPHRSATLTFVRLALPPHTRKTPPHRVPPQVKWMVTPSGGVTAPSGAVAQRQSVANDLSGLTVDVAADEHSSWRRRALHVLEENGAVRLTKVLPDTQVQDLAAVLEGHMEGSVAGIYDTTNSTLARTRRRHVAVSLRLPAVASALDSLAPEVFPLLCDALCPSPNKGAPEVCECDALHLVESGALTTGPGAAAQPLHTDTDTTQLHEGRALKLQLATTDITEEMGPIEVVAGSVRSPPTSAADASPLALPMSQGSAVIYDTRAWHRGGANSSPRHRPIYYLTVLGQGSIPPAGLPYTLEPSEVGCFLFTLRGVIRRRSRRCRRELRTS